MKPVAPGEPTAASERLRRLLFLVPYVSKHQGLTVDEVARAAGLTNAELLEALDLLTLVGRPPFQPDDFIDIYVEDQRVYVDVDQRFSAPPRLTVSEGVALAAAAGLLHSTGGEALQSALAKLERALPAAAVQRVRVAARQLDVTHDGPAAVAQLNRAVSERREVTFDYASGDGPRANRRVQPHELFNAHGHWYLSGWCHARGAVRLFRVDRLSQLAVTEQRFDEGAHGASVRRASPTRADGGVRVRFEASAAPYVRERFGASAEALPDGRLEVRVPGDSERWLAQWVLSFGGDAVVVAPDWAKAAVARAAQASLQSD